MKRELEFEAGEAGEIAVVGAESRAVLDGEGGEVGVHDEGAASAAARKQFAEDCPMTRRRRQNRHVRLREPFVDDRDGGFERERLGENARRCRDS